MKSSDSNESERDEVQMSQNTNSNSNSASLTVIWPTGVAGPRVVKFGYKEFTAKWPCPWVSGPCPCLGPWGQVLVNIPALKQYCAQNRRFEIVASIHSISDIFHFMSDIATSRCIFGLIPRCWWIF